MVPVGLKFQNLEANFFRKQDRSRRLSIDQDESHFAAYAVDGVGALQNNGQMD